MKTLKTISLGIFYGAIIALITGLTLGVSWLTGFALGSILNAVGLGLEISHRDYILYGLALYLYIASVHLSVSVLKKKYD